MRRRALLCAAFALPGAATGCSTGRDAPLPNLTIAGGTPGGVYNELATALAAEVGRRWRIQTGVLPSNESVDNLRLVAEGKAHIGFATVDLCDLALQGDSPFTAVLPVVALAGVYEDYFHLVVAEDSGIQQVAELAKRRVSLGPHESGTAVLATRVLRSAGLTTSSLGQLLELPPQEAATRMLAGNLDAFCVMGGLPTGTVSDLADRMKVRVLSIPDEETFPSGAYSDLYLRRSIPSGMYGKNAEVATRGVGNVLVVHRDMPDDTAFRLTELLFEAKPSLVKAHPEAHRLAPRTAVATFTIPLHRGALRYYRAAKPFS